MSEVSPTYLALLQARVTASAELVEVVPHYIQGRLDEHDIRDRLDDLARIHAVLVRLQIAMLHDLNDNLPVTSKVDLRGFVSAMSEALSDVRGAFAKAAEDVRDEYRDFGGAKCRWWGLQ